MGRIYAGVAVAAMVGLVAGSYLYVRMQRAADPYAECRGGQVAGGSIGGPFTLVDETGATVTERDVVTGPTLIYFGYAWCPDVCPVDSGRNAEATELLEAAGVLVTPVMITLDPARDTPEALRDYTDVMHPRMIGLTGTPDQTAAAARAYRAYSKVRDPSVADYVLDHSTFTYLMQPGADGTPEFLDFFKRELSAQDLADRVACFATKG